MGSQIGGTTSVSDGPRSKTQELSMCVAPGGAPTFLKEGAPAAWYENYVEYHRLEGISRAAI